MNQTTGLPDLPEGYFWRIRETYRGSENIRVEIRKRRIIGSKRIEWHPVSKSEVNPSRILSAAEYALMWMRDGGFDSKGTAWKQHVGDYPPKKLQS